MHPPFGVWSGAHSDNGRRKAAKLSYLAQAGLLWPPFREFFKALMQLEEFGLVYLASLLAL